MKAYNKRSNLIVIAIQLNFKKLKFNYFKWKAKQKCKSGDWLIENQGNVYTVDKDEFAKTYEKVSEGLYKKTSKIWAEKAISNGYVNTLEGETHYLKGDYLVANENNGKFKFAISSKTFKRLYKEIETEQ